MQKYKLNPLFIKITLIIFAGTSHETAATLEMRQQL